MVIVKLPKQLLVWSETEFYDMLSRNPDFHTAGIKRGKWYIRAQREEVRKHAEEERAGRICRGI